LKQTNLLSREKSTDDILVEENKTTQQGKINDHTRSNVHMYLSRCTQLFLREIEEHGYTFQCKVGNPLVSASSTAIEY
jgi:hypothetical protein